MAKTIEQIQDMITIGGDVRQVINEIADYLEANPPGEGGGSVVGFPEGMKIYTALLTQSGTDAPVATVLQNDLGAAIVWTRQNLGEYRGTLTGAFTLDKTWLAITLQSPDDTSYGINRLSANVISVIVPGGDDFLQQTSIEIRVYP